MKTIENADRAESEAEPEDRFDDGRSADTQRAVVLPKDVEKQLRAFIENFDRYAA